MDDAPGKTIHKGRQIIIYSRPRCCRHSISIRFILTQPTIHNITMYLQFPIKRNVLNVHAKTVAELAK